MSDSTVSTSTFIACGIGHPPRNAPSDSEGVIMILSGEYYLNAHRNEIICHQVWTGKTDRGINKVVILTHKGEDWIVGGGRDEHHSFAADEARRCWNHAVDNGAVRVYMRVKSKQSSKYAVGKPEYKYTPLTEDEYLDALCKDPKSWKELAKEDEMWENYALEA